jgi:Fe(3+) dicitrate transport protein
MFLRLSFLFYLFISSFVSFAQEAVYDSAAISKMLSEVFVQANPGVKGISSLSDFDGIRLMTAKKSELIILNKLEANLANQSLRQVFGRTPGLHVIESDPSGFNTSIAIRGLSTNRSWDFNMRQNGYDITPDPMGYNEAYYTPSLEWVEKIEIVRGAAALQYGPQVGGLINYILEKPIFEKKFSGEVQQTFGSFGLNTSLVKARFGSKKLAFVVSHQLREGNGFRLNSGFNSNQSYLRVDWKPFNHGLFSFELTKSDALAQLGGGLSEAQFITDPMASNRSRNHFSSYWLMPVLKFKNTLSHFLNYEIQIFSMQSGRTQLGFLKTNDVIDLPNISGYYANRSLDRDEYRSYGAEIRAGLNSKKEKWQSSFGIRVFKGNMFRQQQGLANNGLGYNEQLIESNFPRSLNFVNQNVSLFVENSFSITPKLKLTNGLRYEYILSQGNGFLAANSPFLSPDRQRNFILWGLGASFRPSPSIEIFGNLSQSFRPISFSDLLPAATTDIIDLSLKDSRAINFDIGIRGKKGNFLRYDVSFYFLQFSDRIGSVSMKNANGLSYLYRTNLGQSSSRGIELYVEIDPISLLLDSPRFGNISLFVSLGLNNSVYDNFLLSSGGNLAGRQIENAPREILRSGLTYTYKRLAFTYQISHTAESFSDAQNTVIPLASGVLGQIPSYTLGDFSLTFKYRKHWLLKGSINNISNVSYFTRRGTGAFPGYGILPAAPQNVSCTLGFTF